MAVRFPFAPGEWYHCYTRGIDKRKTFNTERDYKRFLEALYLSNCPETIHRSNLGKGTDVFSYPRSSPLVDIGAFCLMPNHFHLLLKEINESGISRFMQKLGIAYTMYFNIKYERNGSLFAKPFRSRHIGTEGYFTQVLQYIHCNPAELYEPGWKTGRVQDIRKLERRLLEYPHGSLAPYTTKNGLYRNILGDAVFEVETQLPIREMLQEAQEYYADIGKASP